MSANDIVYILEYDNGDIYPWLFEDWRAAEIVQSKLEENTTLKEEYLDLLSIVNELMGFKPPKITFTEMLEKMTQPRELPKEA